MEHIHENINIYDEACMRSRVGNHMDYELDFLKTLARFSQTTFGL